MFRFRAQDTMNLQTITRAALFSALSIGCAHAQETDGKTWVDGMDVTGQIGQYVPDVFEDRHGHLWFTTLGYGVARYDGKALTYFTEEDGLSHGAITSVAEDAKGRLWFGGHEGLTRYDGKTFRALGPADGFDSAGLASEFRGKGGSVAAEPDGTVWVSTNRAVYRVVDDQLVPFELPIPRDEVTVYAITPGRPSFECRDSKGNLWFRTDGYGALKYDGETFTRFSKEDGLCSNVVNSIREDHAGRIWFICMQAYQPKITGDGGLCRYDGASMTQFKDLRGLSGADLYSLYVEPEGDVWVGATGVGPYRFAGDTPKLFEDIERREDLTRNVGITAILRDSRGELWFGMSGGLFRMKDDRLINVKHDGPWR